MKNYKTQGYRGLHDGVIRLRLQPTSVAGKNVTCLRVLLDTR